MSFDNILQLANGTATITVEGVEEQVKLLTISEKQEYEKLANKGLGKITMGIGEQRTEQKTNLDVEKVTTAQNEADNYLIKTTFTTKDKTITDEDIDKLYNIYQPLVDELKRVNHIREVEPERLEQDIKK